MRILQIGLDKKTGEFLEANRVSLHTPRDVEEASDVLEWMREGHYDSLLINLDSKSWGPYVARVFRKEKLDTPILGIATSKKDVSWSDLRATFLENGGDDLLCHPVNPRELLASLRSVSRRLKGSSVDIFTLSRGDTQLKLDRTTGRVFIDDHEVQLTGKESQLLEFLCVSSPRILTKEAILNNMYSVESDTPEIKIVDVFICKLRKKLVAAAQKTDSGNFIETVWGKGYRVVGY